MINYFFYSITNAIFLNHFVLCIWENDFRLNATSYNKVYAGIIIFWYKLAYLEDMKSKTCSSHQFYCLLYQLKCMHFLKANDNRMHSR